MILIVNNAPGATQLSPSVFSCQPPLSRSEGEPSFIHSQQPSALPAPHSPSPSLVHRRTSAALVLLVELGLGD
jgi:hypothetical protein